MPDVKITVDASCCAGVTPQKHEAALETMRSCPELKLYKNKLLKREVTEAIFVTSLCFCAHWLKIYSFYNNLEFVRMQKDDTLKKRNKEVEW